jgi:hypothetical protein
MGLGLTVQIACSIIWASRPLLIERDNVLLLFLFPYLSLFNVNTSLYFSLNPRMPFCLLLPGHKSILCFPYGPQHAMNGVLEPRYREGELYLLFHLFCRRAVFNMTGSEFRESSRSKLGPNVLRSISWDGEFEFCRIRLLSLCLISRANKFHFLTGNKGRRFGLLTVLLRTSLIMER